MDTFIVVASYDTSSDLSGMMAVRAEEIAQVEALRSEGRLGFVHLSPARGAVFLEVLADDVAADVLPAVRGLVRDGLLVPEP